MSWNPGWEDVGAWLDTLDMTGPTPGLFRVTHAVDGVRLRPVRIDDLHIDADRDRLIDEARD